jgi:hypothetical protein
MLQKNAFIAMEPDMLMAKFVKLVGDRVLYSLLSLR